MKNGLEKLYNETTSANNAIVMIGTHGLSRDDFGNRNLTVQGATNYNTTCKLGNCYNFDGTNDKLYRNDGSDFNYNANDNFTMCFWLYKDSIPSTSATIYKYVSGRGYQIRTETNNKIAIIFKYRFDVFHTWKRNIKEENIMSTLMIIILQLVLLKRIVQIPLLQIH